RPAGGVRAMQAPIATADRDQLCDGRCSSEHVSHSLFYSSKLQPLRHIYPDNHLFEELDPATRLVVSEPLGDLPGAWNLVPESSYGVVGHGEDAMYPFTPVSPEASVYAV